MTPYTIRHGFLDTRLWSPESIVALYKTDLKALGFSSPQLPTVIYPEAETKLTANDPFPGAKSIFVHSPELGDFSQTRDTRVPYAQDTAKLAEAGRAYFSVFTWNLCHPAEGQDGALRNLFRSVKPDIGAHKLSPIVTVWESAPALLPGYPAKPGRPDCDPVPVPGPTGAGTVKKMALWQKIALGVLGAWVAKKSHFL